MSASSHMITAVLSVSATWFLASVYFRSSDLEIPAASGRAMNRSALGGGGPRVPGRAEGKAEADVFGQPHSPGRIQRDANGEFFLSDELAEHLMFSLVTGVNQIDRVEAGRLELSELESSKLDGLLADLEVESHRLESERFVVLDQSDLGVTLEVPGIAAGAGAYEAEVKERIGEAVGEKGSVVYDALFDTIRGLTASFGSDTKIVRVEPDGREYVFKVIQIHPDTLRSMREAGIPLADDEPRASRRARYWSEKVPRSLSHLFDESQAPGTGGPP